MGGLLALGASALAGLAAVVSSQADDPDYVPFFVGLTLLGAIAAWAAHPPFAGPRRRVFDGVLVAWGLAAVWVLGLLITFSGSSTVPSSGVEETSLGLSVTVFHVLGLYGGLGLLLLERWRTTPTGEASGTDPDAVPG